MLLSQLLYYHGFPLISSFLRCHGPISCPLAEHPHRKGQTTTISIMELPIPLFKRRSYCFAFKLWSDRIPMLTENQRISEEFTFRHLYPSDFPELHKFIQTISFLNRRSKVVRKNWLESLMQIRVPQIRTNFKES